MPLLDINVHLEDGVDRERGLNQELCFFSFPLNTGILEWDDL